MKIIRFVATGLCASVFTESVVLSKYRKAVVAEDHISNSESDGQRNCSERKRCECVSEVCHQL
jgi:hypothetical protein